MSQPSKAVTTKSKALPPAPDAQDGFDGLQPLIQAVRAIASEASAMPSERVLAEQLNVKRHQLRRALEALREQRRDRAGAGRPPRRARHASRRGPRRAPPTRWRSSSSGWCWSRRSRGSRRCAPLPSRYRASSAPRRRPGDADPGAADLAFHTAVAAGVAQCPGGRGLCVAAAGRQGRPHPPRATAAAPARTASASATPSTQRSPRQSPRAIRRARSAPCATTSPLVQRQIFARLAPGTGAA